MKPYDHKEIEKKWQGRWEKSGLYKTTEEEGKPKKYVLDMFPYPSGEGLHVGHPKGYIATDVYARFQKMKGFNVLHPMGWDAFGLPAENYALKTKTHPRLAVEKNIARYKEQLSNIGFSYDWSREINTTDPAYYKWTQWIFLKLFERGLAYQSNEPINWCPSCQTGLANEDLEGGVCERCGSEVEKKAIRQWVLKIKEYADRLLDDLETLPRWPEHIKEMQRHWIGKSEGAEIDFPIDGSDKKIKVFTTRPDTLFGATYMVLSPEHPEIEHIKNTIENREEVEVYIEQAKQKTEIERTAEGKTKTGVRLEGIFAINPASKEKVPVFIADYVLAHYGTGAIMAVPAHDERDFEFAKKFNLPIRQVIKPIYQDPINAPREGEEEIKRNGVIILVKHWSEDKYLLNSSNTYKWKILFTGGVEEGEDPLEAAKREVREETGYKNIRSIQKINFTHFDYFFRPHKKGNAFVDQTNVIVELEDGEQEERSVEEENLHQLSWLSKEEMLNAFSHENHKFVFEYAVSGGRANAWDGVLINSGSFDGIHQKEAQQKITEYAGGKMTNTYRLQDWVFSRQRYWGEPIPIIHCKKCGAVPVPEKDLPVILPEVEHYEPTGTGESPLAAIDEWVNVSCPTCGDDAKRETNTMPQWAGSCWYYLRYMDPQNDTKIFDSAKEKHWMPVDVYVGGAEHATRHLIYARFWHKFLHDINVVSTTEPFNELHSVGLIEAEDGRKMSKRWGNVINPDDIVERVGADSLRTYEMFMGPFENAIAWSTNGLVGTRRFIEKVWRLQEMLTDTPVESLETVLHQTIKKVGEDIEAFKFNTAISQMMIFLNAVEKEKSIGREQFAVFIQLLAPFAPHVAEELWEALGNTSSVHLETWPSFDESKIILEEVLVAVQIGGKTRGTIPLSPSASEEEAIRAVKNNERLMKYLVSEPKKVIYRPGKIISFVI